MILDHSRHAARYRPLHPGLAAGLDFLACTSADQWAGLADGRHDLDGDRLYVAVARTTGNGREASRLEVHRRYMDIQIILSGADTMGLRDLATCDQPDGEYEEARDLAFFRDPPQSWIEVTPGMFTIFFPEDAHAPLAGDGPVHKAVIKVAMHGW